MARARNDPDPRDRRDELPEPADPPAAGNDGLRDGAVVKEASRPEVYVLYGNRKVWIPTPAALFAMGYAWAGVRVVADGALDSYQRFDIPSVVPTPGSLLYPPDRVKYFPLRAVPGAQRVYSQGREVQLVELYGWLRAVDAECGDGSDFHYTLELDTTWALGQGIDLNRILRVGNVAAEGITLPGFSPRRTVALPLIEIELNSWGWHDFFPGGGQPPDWTFAGNCGRTWPFDHYQPNPAQPRLAAFNRDINVRGPYVRIAGSLLTDSPHDVQHRPGTILSRYLGITPSAVAEWEGSVPDWHPGLSSDHEDHYARWTEIHPPDLVEVLPWKEPDVTMRAVALCARVGVTPFGAVPSCESVDFDIYPEAPRPSAAQIMYEELRGPECFFPWGEDQNNGSWITVYDDHIHVRARVCGGALGGSPGRFKAIYRVWWALHPPGQGRRNGSFTTSDGDEIGYVVEPGAVDPAIVEFQLCLGPGLTWEKRLNMPDGQGSAWDLIVKDNMRCATNSLWAGQVANGQALTFSKAKSFGHLAVVHTLPMVDLGPLPPGTRVTFTWMTD